MRSNPGQRDLQDHDGGTWVGGASEVEVESRAAAVTVIAIGGSSVELVATYPAVALGLLDGDAVKVSLTLVDDGSVVARYETAMGTGTGIAETTLRPVANATPFPVPSVGG